MVTSSDFNQSFVSLLFKDLKSKEQYVMTAQVDSGGNIDIEAVVRFLLFVINLTLSLGSELGTASGM